jgi:hypothetical protein
MSSSEAMGINWFPTSVGAGSDRGMLISSYFAVLVRTADSGNAIFFPPTKATRKRSSNESS